MELIQGSETSPNYNLTPGKYPEENIHYSNQGRKSEIKKHTNLPHNDPYNNNTLQKDDLLICWTSSSDISGYHADFHEGHGTVGAGQGRGMACVN